MDEWHQFAGINPRRAGQNGAVDTGALFNITAEIFMNPTMTANAGPDSSVVPASTVQLDATVENAETPTYLWTQVDGDVTIELSDSTILNPTYTAGDTGTFVVLDFTVTNFIGYTASDTVRIDHVGAAPADGGAGAGRRRNKINAYSLMGIF